MVSGVENYRKIWSRVYDSPDLLRIREPAPDIRTSPITFAEEQFATLVILHLSGVLEAKKKTCAGATRRSGQRHPGILLPTDLQGSVELAQAVSGREVPGFSESTDYLIAR